MAENSNISERVKKLRHRRIVIDTSVLVKFFIEEENSDFVNELMILHQKTELSLIAPPLIIFEFLSVISKVYKNTEKAKGCLKKFYQCKIGMIDATYGYLERALKGACETNVSYYDSGYHALAKEMQGVFLTADKKYYETMKSKGSIVLLSEIAA